MLSAHNLDLQFEVNDQKQIQSARVFNSEVAEFSSIYVGNQQVTDTQISFSGHNDKSELVNVSINTQEGMQFGASSLQIGDINEQTSCFIGNWAPQNTSEK
jgi:hypothetical protein